MTPTIWFSNQNFRFSQVNVKYSRFVRPENLSVFLLVSFHGSWSLTEGRCPGSKALSLSKTSQFYATTPIISLTERSFTISCWINQTEKNAKLGSIYGDWQDPWQFLLSTKEQKIIFHRHSHDKNEEWWSLTSKEIPLNKWIHLVVTWMNEAGKVFIYADGVEIAYRTFSSSAKFYKSSGHLYVVGNAEDHFQGSVMDLFVFGTALSLDEVNRLRGERFEILYALFYFKQEMSVMS